MTTVINGEERLVGMYRIIPVALAVLTICSQMTSATSEDAEEVDWATTMSSWEFGGREWSYSISDRDLANAPAWPDPEDGEPPLAMARAIAISRQELAKYAPGTTDWILEGIELNLFRRGGGWYYRISWTRRDAAGGCSPGGTLHIPVSMSGKVFALSLLPRRSKESFRRTGSDHDHAGKARETRYCRHAETAV